MYLFEDEVATLAKYSKPLALRVHADSTNKRHSDLTMRNNWLE